MPDHPELHTEQGGLQRRVLHGSGLVLTGQAVRLSLQLGSTVLLARLLAPEAFGLVAMVAAFTSLFMLFGLALTPAIVQSEHPTGQQLSFLFWLNLGLALVLMLAFSALGPMLVWLYGDSRLSAIAAASALIFPLGSAAAIHRGLLIRQLRLGALVAIDLAALAGGLLLAIALAWAGGSLWALVLMPLAQASLHLLGVWRTCRWRPGPPALGDGVGQLVRFGRDLLGVAVLNHLLRELDKVAIGIWYGPAALGLYARACQIYLLPASQLITPLHDVIVPALSRLTGDRDRYVRLFIGSLAALTCIAAALALLLLRDADWIVQMLLGSQWHAAAPVVRGLAAAVAAQPLLAAVGWALISLGESGRYWRLARITGLVQGSALLVALPFGLVAVALSLSLSTWCIAVPLAVRALHRSRLVLGWAAILATAPPLLCACLLLTTGHS